MLDWSNISETCGVKHISAVEKSLQSRNCLLFNLARIQFGFELSDLFLAKDVLPRNQLHP